MQTLHEKGGATFEGIKLLLCENPLPPIEEAIVAAQAEAPRGNYYTEPYSEPLRRLIAEQIGVPERLIHINAGSELILRQLFDRLGQRVHLLTPTYALFPEIARSCSETVLSAQDDFRFDLARLSVPSGTTLVAIVNPNNPNGGTLDMSALPPLLAKERKDERGLLAESPAQQQHVSDDAFWKLVQHHSRGGKGSGEETNGERDGVDDAVDE